MRAVLLGPSRIANAAQAVLRIRWPDFEVIASDDPQQALVLVGKYHPELVFLFTPSVPAERVPFIQQISRGAGAVVALAPERREDEMLQMCDAGVGLYLPADAGPAELVAIILSAGRVAHAEEQRRILRCGNVTIYPERYEVWVDGEEVHLTPTEFKLLCHLITDQGRLVTHSALHKLIWGCDENLYADSLRKNIMRLRKKLARSPASGVRIVSVARLGYKLVIGVGAPVPAGNGIEG